MQEIKVISLFSGCGGMDLGFEGGFKVHRNSINTSIHNNWISNMDVNNDWITLPRTGFSTIFANDILLSSKVVWENNFNHLRGSTGSFNHESIVNLVKLANEGKFSFPKAQVVIGGFPCQDFSVAGKRKGFKSEKSHQGVTLSTIDDPTIENRGMLYIWMKRVIELVLPNVFVAENVKGLISLADAKAIIQNDFRTVGSGYTVLNAKVLNAKNYGVPQNRERIIFIGLRNDLLKDDVLQSLNADLPDDNLVPYPPKTHHDSVNLFEKGLKPLVNTATYLKDLKEPHESNDPDQKAYSRAKYYGPHCQGNKEIDIDSVSPTIRSEHHGNIEFRRLSIQHGGKNISELNLGLLERRLTVRECARLQTFPDDFYFTTKHPGHKNRGVSTSDAYKLIGNAVPPLLAFHIAMHIKSLWKKYFGDYHDSNEI